MKKLLLAILTGIAVPVLSFGQAANWSPATPAPYFRNINAVQVLGSGRIIAVGGNPANDAITSVYYSDDSAATWNIALDMVNAMLNDVHFPDFNTGYAVGNSGRVYKTTNSGAAWSPITLPGNLASRHYNGVHFIDASTGIAVGGNKANDAIQTIIRTTDGGQSWSVISDNLSSWLLDVTFTDATNGFAVGDQGKILKTTDAGLTWSAVPVSGNLVNRQFHGAHFFTPQTGIVVGGFPANDSVQTLIRTTDGGQNWSIVKDNIASMLKTVHFINATEGYAAGNDGVMLHSLDQGATWASLNIAGNDAYAINDIHFGNLAFGMAGGRSGKTLVYANTSVSLPSASVTTPVAIVNANTVEITGQVSANGVATNIEFEYGTTAAFGTSVPMLPGSISGNQEPVSLLLPGLQPGNLYFGRIKASSSVGTAYSNVVQFYTGLTTVPNFNFENWDSFSFEALQNWQTAGQVQKVASFNGSLAAKVKAVSNQEPGAILFANVGGNGIQPLAYAGRPDTLSFYANYDISPADTALVVLMLKSGGNMVAETMYKISGTSGGQFNNIKVPVSYTSAAIPDSMALLFISTNFFSGNISTQSELTIDNVVLSGTGAQLANSNMENWATSTRHSAVSWWSQDDMNYHPGDSALVLRTTDAYSGDYALLLRNNPATGQFAQVNTGDGYNQNPDFAVQHRHSTLNGYYKFSRDDNDTLFVYAVLYRQGAQVGYVYHSITQSANQYTLFSLPISYSSPDVPDSAHVSFSIRKGNGNLSPGNSWAILDNLSFDGVAQPLSAEGTLPEAALQVQVYPNPARDEINLVLNGADKNQHSQFEVAIYDLSGRLQFTKTIGMHDKATIDVRQLRPQMYFLIIHSENKFFTTKFIKGL